MMNKKLLCMFMIGTLILPTCGKRITKTLVEPQSSLDSHALQPAKKGEETWKDYFTKDWTARKVLTVGAAGLVITLAMGYTIKTAYTSYKSYRERKIQSIEQNQALQFQEKMIEGMIKEPTQQELEAFKEHQKIDRNLPVFRQQKYQVNVRDSVPPKIYPIKKNNEIRQNDIFNEIDRAVMEQDVVEQIKDRHIIMNLCLDMASVSGPYFICNPNSTYMWKSKVYNWTKYIRYDKGLLGWLIVQI